MTTLGVDLGGTTVRAAVVDENGRVLASDKVALGDRQPEAVAELIVRSASEALRLARVPALQVQGCAVGVAGMIARGTGVVLNAPNLEWRDVPLQDMLARLLPCPVRIYNDLSAAAFGEAHAGAGRGATDVILVFVGTGVGAGLILGARLHEGATGISGELGHIKVRPGGRLCGCGERGCLEAYAGGANLAALAQEGLDSGQGEHLRLLRATEARVSASMLDQAARQGDALASALLEDAGTLLGVEVANLVTLLNPGVLILGGGVLSAAPRVKELLVEGVRTWTSAPSRRALTITDAALGDDAGVIGAALLARS